ncbi:MAG: DedA family protein [Dehalococcoidia bacterium]|nr:MAG: DedA family protein [Dehalococcoidia bacterium]
MDIIDSLPPGLVSSLIAYEYLALIAILFVSEAAIPLPFPSYVLVIYAGFLAQNGQGNVFLILISSVFGAVLGSWLLYAVASRGGHRLLQKYGKYVRLHPEKLTKAETWFNSRGGIAIVLGRLIPGIRCQTTIAAGLFKVRRRVFLCATTLSTFIWISCYLCMGFLLGSGYGWVNSYLNNPYLLITVLLAVVTVPVILTVLKSRRRAVSNEPIHRGWMPVNKEIPALQQLPSHSTRQ